MLENVPDILLPVLPHRPGQNLQPPILPRLSTPISDKRILQKEYFIQQMMSTIASQPADQGRRLNRTELAGILLDQQSKRPKRSNTRMCSSSTDTEHCCMDSVEIDLHDLGWTFVIFPRTVEYKFCRGSCNPEFVGPSVFTSAATQLRLVSHIRVFR